MIWFEWFSTAVLILGVGLTSLNIFPWNLYISLTGNLLWFIIGVRWRKWSLVTIQAIIVILYVFGVINHLLLGE